MNDVDLILEQMVRDRASLDSRGASLPDSELGRKAWVLAGEVLRLRNLNRFAYGEGMQGMKTRCLQACEQARQEVPLRHSYEEGWQNGVDFVRGLLRGLEATP